MIAVTSAVIDRASRQQNAVLAAADDLAIPGDDSAKRPAPALFDRLDRQPRGFFHEPALAALRRRLGPGRLRRHRRCRDHADRGHRGGCAGEERTPAGVGQRIAGAMLHGTPLVVFEMIESAAGISCRR
jgi:hypothetical protein